MIDCKDISFSYQNRGLTFSIQNLSVQFKDHSFYTLLGKNGSGKTTLLKIIAGIISPENGDITVEEHNTKNITNKILASKISYLSSEILSEFNIKVIDFVLLGKIPHYSPWKGANQKDRDEAKLILKKLSIDNLRDRNLFSLSTGQKQIVYLAKILLQNPVWICLDELNNGLDPSNQIFLYKAIRDELKNPTSSLKGVISICHDINLSLKFSDKLIGLKSGEIQFIKETRDLSENDLNLLFDFKFFKSRKDSFQNTQFVIDFLYE